MLALKLDSYLLKAGIELSHRSKENILRELTAWLNPSALGSGLVITQDGSYTLVSSAYGEPYHSISAGAIRECILKFVEPSTVLERSKVKSEVKLLDIGFGLGYNLAVAIKHLRDINPKVRIEIVSFEKDLLQDIPLLPEPYRQYHKLLLDALPELEKDGISFKLFIGDARQKIKEVEGFGADAVFHDGFSPYRNPELWSYDFLKEIKQAMAEDGFWVSYTSSLPVRKALHMLSFGIANSRSVGRKRSGTVASPSLKDSLGPEEIKKLSSSPYAIPFRDENLKMEPLEILIDYRVRVELLKVAQGGIEPPTPRFSAGCSTN